MKRFMILGIVASIVMLLAPVSAISAPAGPPGGLEVKIVDQPVEVKGEVDATVSGEVEVTNDLSNPVPVKIEDNKCSRRIVNYYGSTNIGDNAYAAYIWLPDNLQPKEGEILVVETVSVNATLSENQEDFVKCGIYVGGIGDYYLASWPMQGFNIYYEFNNETMRTYASTKQLRLYLSYAGGDKYGIGLNFAKSEDNILARGTIQGYIVSDECPNP